MGNWIEFSLFFIVLLVAFPILGYYMAMLFKDGSDKIFPFFGWLEKSIYRLCHINPYQEMNGREYVKAILFFNLFGFLFLFILQLFQGWLPLNHENLPGVEPSLAFNTAISFVTNTNWQAYGGESTMSYLTQMLGLTPQNFLSAATGNGVLLALIRGIQRQSSQTIGNFWQDLTRTVVYLLLPLSFIFSLILISQGVVQTLSPYIHATTLENQSQIIPLGPVASQIAIKQLGTNGGGFFNANSCHPFENPTPFSNFLENFAILWIPAAATYMYGLMVKSRKDALVLFLVMLILWLGGLAIAQYSESLHNPVLKVNPVLEGKETRFGILDSVTWAVSTTATSNGSINCMHDSLSPIAGGIALFNMMIGEMIFGGVGVGLCSMLMFVLLTVFLSGLMVGRTPEYMSKKIEKTEMQWVMLAILAPGALILLGSGLASVLKNALKSLGNEGPHGFSEILYTFSSTAGNNGSGFEGLNANTHFYNLLLGLVMLLARLAILIPSVAIATSLASKAYVAKSRGTFSTETPLFGILLFGIILIVAALTFFPALSLGPIVEQMLMLRGDSF